MTIAVRTSAILILFCAFLILSYPVWAEDATSSTTRKDKVQERIETRKENIKDRVETRKDVVAGRIDERKAAMASREAALKARLDAFKDKRKAQATERVSTNLNKINEKHTQMMLKFLTRASEILTKLENRVNQATPDIKDMTAAKDAIASAKAAIASATEAVNLQAAKDYTITVTSEGRVKDDAQASRKQLHEDLLVVRRQVIAAKQAVSNAIRVAKSGKVERGEATQSGQ